MIFLLYIILEVLYRLYTKFGIVSRGLSQSELATQSGVNLRSIQMYEQRNKDINKANAETVYRLAKVLGCTMEDLIENNTQ